ncbi:MAG TPA: AAA family ATPase [Solirubrobacterales bacterium]|nr:AAA family ATPase [Solirubrobacterales bacterium]
MGARVQLCGRLQVDWDGEQLADALPGRQGRLLFTYLTLHRERLVRRDELVEALWSEEGPPPGGDALLRPPLSRLRRALGPDRLDGRGELALRFPEDTWVDREVVEVGLRRSRAAQAEGNAEASWERAREALEIAERGLLPGLEVRWLEPFRAELEEQRVELLEAVALAGAQLGDGERQEAERAARRAIEVSPFRESARVALLEVLRARGNTAEALVAFEEFRTFLREELGSAPGAELRTMHEQLLSAEPAGPRPAAEAASATVAEEQLSDRLVQALASPWVGRSTALARLREEAETAAAGQSGLVLVVGEGGIGKTRLVAELATELTGFDVLYGRCDEEEIFPYGPWVEMLRPRLRRLDDFELAALTGSEAADLARLLPEICERLPELAEAPAPSNPETERRQLFVAVHQLLRRLAAVEPLLIVVDDLHWADRSSLLLGRHLARQQQLGRLLLVGTYRDTELGHGHPLADLIADVERYRPVPRVRLGGMDEREVAALIGSWHGSEVEENAVRAIRAETSGNPFFVKQLVRHLEETGGGAELTGGERVAVPEGVRDVIAQRVARLPEGGDQALQVAALIGRDFEYGLLERVVDLPEEQLLDVLDAAVRGALLAEVPNAPGRYSFAHALLRSTVEGELSATRRARLHRRIGEAIEQLHRERLDPWLDELARHFAAAVPQEIDRAVDYAMRAAAQASARLAYDEAAQLLARAVALRRSEDPVDHAELARLEIALASAEADAGRWETARASFARAADVARAGGAGTTFARAALGHCGETWEQYGRGDAESIELVEEALDRLPEGDSPLLAQVLARLAVLLYHDNSGSRERVLAAADEAVAIARRLDDPATLIAALTAAQHARWWPGMAPDRLAIAEELIELAEASGTAAEASEAHLWPTGALLELCRLDEADAHLQRQAEIAEGSQQFQLLAHRDATRGMRALLEGDFEGAEAMANELLEWGKRTEADGGPMPLVLQFYGTHMLVILSERDELGALTPYCERMVREMRGLPGWRGPLAWSYVQGGERERGQAELEDLSADGFAVLPRDINFLPTLAMASHAIGQLEDVGALAARIEPLLQPFRELWVVLGVGGLTLGPVAFSLGMTQLAQDHDDDAIASFELALERSLAMRARPYVTRSRAGLAAALGLRGAPGDAERAGGLAELAATDARELGMLRLQRELGLTPG